MAEAVAFYAAHDRLHAQEDRDEALQAAVDAWAADVTAGTKVGLYAWRRANVAELNTRARAWMATNGHLTGPEVTCPGGTTYRAGDHVIALAPSPNGTLVTSQRATVTTVDPAAGAVTLSTAEGGVVRLAGEDAGADRLGYGYATTVHRAQGETVDRAHLYADGGGRELAYVAMSRARHSTHVWTVADDTDQAAEDLRRDWANRRTPIWALDTGLPAPGDPPAATSSLPESEKARIAALRHAQEALAGAASTGVQVPDGSPELAEARAALDRARQHRADLDIGTGVYADTPAGQAVADTADVQYALTVTRWAAQHGERRRDRRNANRQIPALEAAQADAARRWATHVDPEAARIDRQITHLEATVSQLTARHQQRTQTAQTVVDAGFEHQRAATQLARRLDARLDARRDHLDGVGRARPEQSAGVRGHSPAAAPTTVPEPPALHAGPDM